MDKLNYGGMKIQNNIFKYILQIIIFRLIYYKINKKI